MAMKIRLDVFKSSGKYYAMRILLDMIQEPEQPFPGERVFSITADIENITFSAFEEKARQEARQLGIDYVINLDPSFP